MKVSASVVPPFKMSPRRPRKQIVPLCHKHILKEVNNKVRKKIKEKDPLDPETDWGQELIEQLPEFLPHHVPHSRDLVEVGQLGDSQQQKIYFQIGPEFEEGSLGARFQLTVERLQEYLEELHRCFADQARQSFRSGDRFMAEVYSETLAEILNLVPMSPDADREERGRGLWVRSS